MTVKGRILAETDAYLFVENMRIELSREMEYNDRNDAGNKDAVDLFREQWHFFSQISPLCAMAFTVNTSTIDDQKLIGMKGPEKAVVVSINKVDELFQNSGKKEEDPRDFITELFMRICYLCEKLERFNEVAE